MGVALHVPTGLGKRTQLLTMNVLAVLSRPYNMVDVVVEHEGWAGHLRLCWWRGCWDPVCWEGPAEVPMAAAVDAARDALRSPRHKGQCQGRDLVP